MNTRAVSIALLGAIAVWADGCGGAGERTPEPAPRTNEVSAAGAKPGEGAVNMKGEQDSGVTNAFSVSKNGQEQLLKIARQSIESYLKDRREKSFDVTDPELTAPGAVFVTLTQRGQLRGCIGTTEPREPLFRAVAGLAVAAAVSDNRFQPLDPAELGVTHIEISVLSPMRRVKDASEVRQGEHGVVVRRGRQGGLFLPQVWEHFGTKEAFLDELCRQKAHLPASAWKDPSTELYVFTVFAFEEHQEGR